MQRGLTRYDEESLTPASTDDESCPSSDLDLLNPSFHALLTEEVGKENTGSSSLQHFPGYSCQKRYEVTFATEKSSSGGEDLNSKSLAKLWRGKSTPRIVRAIRRNSRKFEPDEDRSESSERPRPRNSKSSVVVLYHEKSATPPPATSPEPPLRATQSERVVARGTGRLLTETDQPLRHERADLVGDTEGRSPVYPIARRKATLRRRRRLSKRQGPLNVHVYQESRVRQAASLSKDHRVASKEVQPAERGSDPTRYSAKSAKNLIRSAEGSATRREDDSDDRERGERSSKHWQLHSIFRERCRPSNNSISKLMARSSPGRDGDSKQRRSEVCPNLAYLMQQVHSRPRERGDDRAFISVNNGDDARRVFPFQATPSGNLKIVPNQVVFESKKVSVLVADPRHTKVNVKAELNRPGNEPGGRASDSSTRPRLIDLPAGFSSSAVNQLQARRSRPNNEDEHKPAMHPFKAKLQQMEMGQKQQATPSTSYQMPLLQEVPLSALGFTSEQPIDWDNIILPEKTDLYQELARRITNYKNADCIVRIDQDEFHCHLLVLQSYSAFFDEKNCKEIDLTGSDVNSRAFSIIYDWMISSQNESCRLLQRDNILEVFTAAQYLGIKELEEQCWAFIDNDELFTEDTAFLLYIEARKMRNTAVMELMVPRIMKFFLMLVSTKDFLELSVDELCLLLKSNYICVNSEMEVLMSAVRWLMHDWETRKQRMLEVLKCVRFGLIAPWQLVDVKRNPENPEFMELMSFHEVQKMVDDGLAFVIIKYWYGNQTEDYYHWIDLLGLSEPTNRNWAGEDKNYVTYREFLLYLEEYQRTKYSELKAGKTRAKPTPPDSPPNDYSFVPPRMPNNYAQSAGTCNLTKMNPPGDTGAVQNDAATHSRRPNVPPPNYMSMEMPEGMAMPPKFMNEYLSNLERSKGKIFVHTCMLISKTVAILKRFREACMQSVNRRTRMEITADITCGTIIAVIVRENLENDRSTTNGTPVNAVTFDARFTGGGESPKTSYKSSTIEKHQPERCQRGVNLPDAGKLDYESQQEKNAADVCRCRQSNLIFSAKKQRARCTREREERTDSGKSEEEAATTIQAVYRGYKARRRFHEIRKSTSGEKRNMKKVAELLAIPMGESVRKPPLEPIRIANSSANQIRQEKEETWPLSPRRKSREQPGPRNQNPRCTEDQLDRAQTPVSIYRALIFNRIADSHKSCDQRAQRNLQNQPDPRDVLHPIRTMFVSNYNERTSSPSENTDTDDTFSPRLNQKWTKETNYPDVDNVQRVKSDAKSVQIRASGDKRPLPQRISSSMLDSNINGYFFDNSLFFPDREAVLVFGGVDPHEEYGRAGNTGKDMYRFKPDENIWEFVGEIPQARHHHSIAYLRGRIYVVGGADPVEDKLHRKSTAVGSVWSYDPTTRTWFNEPSMLTARKDFGLVVSHGKMYAMGGQDRNGIALKTTEAFDPSECTWREMQPMQTARVGPASVKYRDLIWVAGGMTKSKKELFSRDVECYDPIKNLWLKAVSLRSPRCFASFYVVSDCLYVIGGASTTENGTQSTNSIDIWDGNESVWKEQANMSIARHGHSTGSIGDQLLIIGGVTTVFMKTLNSVECYCCDIGKWMKGVSALPHPVSGHGTVSLPPANLLIDR
ncbi:uncharacterized protein LOC143372435 [Andrena cerasifolii]|uniref:uncharacterized protein LOC143372435 n=1 Tax=Andrena cerasifolii TaxID=2819439 RepID=UPI00403776F2